MTMIITIESLEKKWLNLGELHAEWSEYADFAEGRGEDPSHYRRLAAEAKQQQETIRRMLAEKRGVKGAA